MMRAVLILAGIGTLVAMELGTPPRAKTVNQPLAQATVGGGDSRDSLAKPDRLEIPYFQNELPAQPTSFVARAPQADSAPVISKEPSRTVSGNRLDAKAKKVAVAAPKPRKPEPTPRPKTTASKTTASKATASKATASKATASKTTDAKTVTNTDRSKAPVDVKPCRPNAFESFLKALNLSSGCEA